MTVEGGGGGRAESWIDLESLENPRRIILKLIPSSAPSSAENLPYCAHPFHRKPPSPRAPFPPLRGGRGDTKGGEEKQGKPPSRDLRGEKYASRCAGCRRGWPYVSVCRSGGSGGGGGGGRWLFRRWRWKGGQKVRPARIGPLAWGGAPFRLSSPLSSPPRKPSSSRAPSFTLASNLSNGGKIFSLWSRERAPWNGPYGTARLHDTGIVSRFGIRA